MSSHVHGVATAVKNLLNGHAFSTAFTASVAYDTDLTLDDISTLHVDIVSATMTQSPSSRITLENLVGVDIAVRYRFGTGDQETDGSVDQDKIDTYLSLLEEIGRYLASNPYLTTPTAIWRQNNIKASWVPDHMHQNRQYTGILQAVYIVEDVLS